MPMREYACDPCNALGEKYHPSIDPDKVPVPDCPLCGHRMHLEVSAPNLDTSTCFSGVQDYSGPDGRKWAIDSLHKMRKVEKAYEESGQNIRFDAWSAEPSNPDVIDGFGPEYHDGTGKATGKTIVSLPN